EPTRSHWTSFAGARLLRVRVSTVVVALVAAQVMAMKSGVADSRPAVAGDKFPSAAVPQYLSQPDTGSWRWDRPAARRPPAECRPPNKSSGRDRYKCGCKWGSASFVKAQIIGKAQTSPQI